MVTAEKFRTLIWITALLKQCGPITLSEINERWLEYPLSQNIEFDRNTFRRYLNVIEDVFHITITCNKSNKYYIEDPVGLDERTSQNQLLTNLQEAEFLLQFRCLGSKLQPMDIPHGHDYLLTIGKALKELRYLQVVYQKFGSIESYCFKAKPFCLKAVDRRWYMLAQKDQESKPKIFALDRVKDMKLLNETFTEDEVIDAGDYFQGTSGIFVNQGPLQKVVLQTNSWLSHYLETLPLHHSQQQVSPGLFEYHMQVTPELEKQILSYGENMQVVEPLELKSSILRKVQAILINYQ